MINVLANVCGLIICSLLYYFDRYRNNTKSYLYMVYRHGRFLSTINLIVSTLRIESINYDFNIYIVYSLTMIYHILNAVILAILVIFSMSLIPSCERKINKYLKFVYVFIGIVSTIVLTSFKTHIFYYVENGQIMSGHFPILGFFISFVCFSVIMVNTIVHYKEIDAKKRSDILIFIFVPLGLALIEFFQKDLSLGGFSYACVLLTMYNSFYVENFEEKTGLRTKTAYIGYIQSLLLKKKKFRVIIFNIKNWRLIKSIYSATEIKEKIAFVNSAFSAYTKHSELYYIGDNKFAAVFSYIDDSKLYQLTSMIESIFDRVKYNNTDIRENIFDFAGCVCKMGDLFTTIDELRFIENNEEYYGSEKQIIYLDDKVKKEIAEQNILVGKIRTLTDEFHTKNGLENIKDIDMGLVEVYYQPIYDIHTKTFRSAEALIRLKIQELGGIIAPYRFIPYLEKNNSIHEFSCVVLAKVCEFIKELEKANKDIEGISVNFSSTEFANYNFERDVLSIVNAYGVSPSKIHIEITETCDVEQLEDLKEKMERLKLYGFKFYLDDFGTGFSNITRLVELPFDVVKFDKSLIDKSIISSDAQRLVKNLTTTIAETNLNVLYEGIENDIGDKMAKDYEVSFIQGYKYARPMPKEDAQKYFS